jgi:hypothetical protein
MVQSCRGLAAACCVLAAGGCPPPHLLAAPPTRVRPRPQPRATAAPVAMTSIFQRRPASASGGNSSSGGGFTHTNHLTAADARSAALRKIQRKQALEAAIAAERVVEFSGEQHIGIRVQVGGVIGWVMPLGEAAKSGVTTDWTIVAVGGHRVGSQTGPDTIAEWLSEKPVQVRFRPHAPALGAASGGSGRGHLPLEPQPEAEGEEEVERRLIVFTVTCPPGRAPGDLARFRAPSNGRMYEVKIPKGVEPGQEFPVHADSQVTCDGCECWPHSHVV